MTMSIATTTIQTILIMIFLISGVGKVSGLSMHVNNFKRLQLPQWFRVVTGTVQLIGAAGLAVGYFYPHWAMFAGIGLALTMAGAIWAHVRIKDDFKQTVAAIVLFCVTIAYLICLMGN
jgi:putative oxidoreductase